MLVVAGELGFDVHLDRDGNVVFEQPKDAAVAFDLGNDDGKGNSCIAVIGSTAECCSVVVEDDTGATAVFGVAAGNDDAGDLFFGKEWKEPAGKLGALEIAFDSRLRIGVSTLQRKGLKILEVLVGVAFEKGLVRYRHVAHRAEQDNFAGKFSSVFRDIALVVDDHGNGRRGHRSVARR